VHTHQNEGRESFLCFLRVTESQSPKLQTSQLSPSFTEVDGDLRFPKALTATFSNFQEIMYFETCTSDSGQNSEDNLDEASLIIVTHWQMSHTKGATFCKTEPLSLSRLDSRSTAAWKWQVSELLLIALTTEIVLGPLRIAFQRIGTDWMGSTLHALTYKNVLCGLVQFGQPYLEGEHLHAVIEDAAHGICLSLDLRVALKDPDKRAGSDILPQSAITGLRLSLTSRFLTDWFGMSHV
jgi:hypothetical protein